MDALSEGECWTININFTPFHPMDFALYLHRAYDISLAINTYNCLVCEVTLLGLFVTSEMYIRGSY